MSVGATKSGEIIDLIPVGTRIRAKGNPELTGYIKAHEFADRDHISAIPYLIGWDDSEAAYSQLGFLFVYAGNEIIEAVVPE